MKRPGRMDTVEPGARNGEFAKKVPFSSKVGIHGIHPGFRSDEYVAASAAHEFERVRSDCPLAGIHAIQLFPDQVFPSSLVSGEA